jgi:hypothetical protein
MNRFRITRQMVLEGSYWIYKRHDGGPIDVLHLSDTAHGYIGVYATKTQALRAAQQIATYGRPLDESRTQYGE